jgi:hypothetical protein
MRLLFRAFWAVVCFCAVGLPVSAQDNTPQPQQSFILGWTSEVIFPQAIRFTVTLSRPLSELSSATLIVQPDGGDEAVIEVNLDETAVVREPYSELAYIWQIPRTNLPTLFQDIEFSWRLTSRRDEVAAIDSSLIFTDQRTAWLQQSNGQMSLTMPGIDPSTEAAQILPGDLLVPSTPQSDTTSVLEATMDVATLPPLGQAGALTPEFSLPAGGPQPTTDSPDTAVIEQVLRDMGTIYDFLSENTGLSPSLNVLVYTNSLPPGCVQNGEGQSVAIGPVSGVEIPCDSTLASIIIRTSGYDLVESNSDSLNGIKKALTAYLTDEFYASLWAGKEVPAWFASGLAQFYTPGLKVTSYPPLLTAARNDNLFSLDMFDEGPSSSEDLDLWQAQSYGLILYIADQIGVPRLFALARDIQDAETFADAYQSALNKPITALVSDFKNWVFTDQAASAFEVDIYQPATFTPTPSRTPTFTPTFTPTPTLTLTFTATVTGVLTNTPTATFTPSSTPTPEPPTPTPRPPGSLNTPTPVPPQTINPVNALSNPVVALGILTVGLVVIAVIALILMRFRNK